MKKNGKLNYKETMEKVEADIVFRRKIFNDLCTHLREGYSFDCFPALSDTAIRKYTQIYPEDFVQEDIDNALRLGKQTWETIGHRQATGQCLGNSRTWYYNMSNRYGWRDKVDIEAEHRGSLAVSIVNYARPDSVGNSEKGDSA